MRTIISCLMFVFSISKLFKILSPLVMSELFANILSILSWLSSIASENIVELPGIELLDWSSMFVTLTIVKLLYSPYIIERKLYVMNGMLYLSI